MSIAAPPSEKSVLTAFIAFGVLAIVLGAMGLRGAILRPVNSRVSAPLAPSGARTADELREQQRVAAATLDTDRDGLSDLEELERTRTSPFLADSDSDGRNDADEVAAGTDPNCPIGTTCAAQSATAVPKPDMPINAQAAGAQQEGAAAVPAVAELRAALERQGVSRATLDRLSDEQITTAYRSTIAAIPGASESASPFAGILASAFSNAAATGGDPAAMTRALPRSAREVRALLAATAFPKEELAKLDDVTLERVWASMLDAYAAELRAGARAPAPQP